MEKYQRLRSGNPMKKSIKHLGMAMIELIFAIVIIAISVMTIPSMMNIANEASKVMVIDEDVVSRLSGWTLDKFQARWDGNYSASGSGALNISGTADLNCSRAGGYRIGSDENISSMQCNMNAWDELIPSTAGSGTGQADGNISKGIEMLNTGSETITITPIGGAAYSVTATYAVDYVSASVTPLSGSNIQNATWILGTSTDMNPSPAGGTTHLKRVVTRFQNAGSDIDTTLTFFKSNKGN